MKESVEISKTYEILELIGRGSYASVHKAINKHTGKICAIKKMAIRHSEITTLMEEIRILSNCKSENIVQYLDSKCPPEEVLIVMEYCSGGSVKDLMKQLGRTLTPEQITVITRDVLKGLDYLHAQNKIHRDVKGANILLDQEGVAKLGDFGVSESLDQSARNQASHWKGTELWLPPEVINRGPIGFPIDIWSLGITIVEMGDGHPPYNDLERSIALKEIGARDKPAPSFRDQSKWPQNLLDFLGLCLDKDAMKRKSAKELLTYDLIRKARPNIIIKNLVNDLVNQTETSLSRKYQSLWKEHCILHNIYHERKKKVIKVDQMILSHEALNEEFTELLGSITKKNKEIIEIREQSRLLEDDIQKLERMKNELCCSLEEKRRRKSDIKDQLDKIKQKQEDELRLKAKLKALEGH